MRAIDADALIEAINTWPKFGVDGCGRIVPWNEGYEPYIHLRDAVIAISALRQPERKKGKWIVHYECPKCGEITKDFMEYCPFCGADMRG